MSLIKINKDLMENVYRDPSKESQSKSIAKLCEEIKDGLLIMPIFQRGLAWTEQKKVDLFNFQLNGAAPVSPISINKIGPKSIDMPHVELLTRKDVDNIDIGVGNLSIIDGQQRITTNYQAYIDDPSVSNIMLNILRGKFVIGDKKNIKRYEVPVGILYNQSSEVFRNYIESKKALKSFEILSLLQQIRAKFMNYYYTVNFANDLPGEDQIEWFNVLNLAGSSVSLLEMQLTVLQIRGLDFYKEYSKYFIETLVKYGYENLFVQKKTEVSIPLATLNPAYELIKEKKHSNNYSPMASDAKDVAVLSMENDDLRKAFKMTIDALEKSCSFVRENQLEKPDRIDKLTYLTGFFVYYPDSLKNTSAQKITLDLIKWYNTVNFTNKGNTERRQIFTDLLEVGKERL